MDRRENWKIRQQEIERQYPSIQKLNWNSVFKQDPESLGRVINDILKIKTSKPGKPGKRPPIDTKIAAVKLNQIMGDDYTEKAFKDSFRDVIQGESLKEVSRKTNIPYHVVTKLASGLTEPTMSHMESIATAYHHEPSYFLEYRVKSILKAIEDNLLHAPEVTVSIFKKVK